VRIGQDKARHRRAVKVWDKREFKDFAEDADLGPRAIKLALRRLRRFARDGAATELDLPDTIRSTAEKAGLLDLKLVPERHNAVKVLLLIDHGGSMDDHVQRTVELFSAARAEFKHLETYYFHNCLYEKVWRSGRDRWGDRAIPTQQVLHTFPADWKLIFVGDATMSPYEITVAGGSVEHWNQEPGAVWMQRALDHFRSAVWLNPQPERAWRHIPSLQMLHKLMAGRMYPLTLEGLDTAMASLRR